MIPTRVFSVEARYISRAVLFLDDDPATFNVRRFKVATAQVFTFVTFPKAIFALELFTGMLLYADNNADSCTVSVV